METDLLIRLALLDGPLTRRQLRDRLWAEAYRHWDDADDERRHRRTSLQVLSRRINVDLPWMIRMKELSEGDDGLLHLTQEGADHLIKSPEFRFVLRQGVKFVGWALT